MRCPKCRFVSSDKKDLCPKCQIDLRPYKKVIGVPISHPEASLSDLIHEHKTGGLPSSTPSSKGIKSSEPTPSAQSSASRLRIPAKDQKSKDAATGESAPPLPAKKAVKVKESPKIQEVEEKLVIELELDDEPKPVSIVEQEEDDLPDLFAAADELFEKITEPVIPLAVDSLFEVVPPPNNRETTEPSIGSPAPEPSEEELDHLFAKVIQSAQPTVVKELSVESLETESSEEAEEMLFSELMLSRNEIIEPETSFATLSRITPLSSKEQDMEYFSLLFSLDDEHVSEAVQPFSVLNSLNTERENSGEEIFLIQALLEDEQIQENSPALAAFAHTSEELVDADVVHLLGSVYVEDEVPTETHENAAISSLQANILIDSDIERDCTLLCIVPIDETVVEEFVAESVLEPALTIDEPLTVNIEIQDSLPEPIHEPSEEEIFTPGQEVPLSLRAVAEEEASSPEECSDRLPESPELPQPESAQKEELGELRTSEVRRMLELGPKSALPSVMELSEEDLEAQLDELLTDEEIDFTPVATPRPSHSVSLQLKDDGDDLEITFEVDIEGEESSGGLSTVVHTEAPQTGLSIEQLMQMMESEDAPEPLEDGIAAATNDIQQTLGKISERSHLWLEAEKGLPINLDDDCFEISSLELCKGAPSESTLLLFEGASQELARDLPLAQLADVKLSERKQLREAGFSDLLTSAVEFVKAEERGELPPPVEDGEVELPHGSSLSRLTASGIDLALALVLSVPVTGLLFYELLVDELPLLSAAERMIEVIRVLPIAAGSWILCWFMSSTFFLFARGQTVGQRWLKLITVGEDGAVPNLSQATLRNLLVLGYPTGLLFIGRLLGVALDSTTGTSVRQLERS